MFDYGMRAIRTNTLKIYFIILVELLRHRKLREYNVRIGVDDGGEFAASLLIFLKFYCIGMRGHGEYIQIVNFLNLRYYSLMYIYS